MGLGLNQAREQRQEGWTQVGKGYLHKTQGPQRTQLDGQRRKVKAQSYWSRSSWSHDRQADRVGRLWEPEIICLQIPGSTAQGPGESISEFFLSLSWGAGGLLPKATGGGISSSQIFPPFLTVASWDSRV